MNAKRSAMQAMQANIQAMQQEAHRVESILMEGGADYQTGN